ncbi:MAG: peptidoglycan recognition protein family protein [Acidobacteriia bacterium]|nr:peptidoglycan recognition protein family protein [Terriglobia bacterium]
MARAQSSNAPGKAPAAKVQDLKIIDLKIIDRPINFDKERIQRTIAYRRAHQNPKANDVIIQPRMIILHWTGISSFNSTWNYFNAKYAEEARPQLAAAGDVNVSAHFLIDRDGTIYRLMPENWMARHCIGLNHVAIGIENVGDNDRFPLTDAQVQSNAALVRYLAKKWPITHLIGHHEYRRMEKHPYFLELDPKYRNQKPDPGDEFMSKVRALVADLKLQGPPEEKPHH